MSDTASTAWGVFLGLFAFFILLPVALFATCMAAGVGLLSVAADTPYNTTAELPAPKLTSIDGGWEATEYGGAVVQWEAGVTTPAPGRFVVTARFYDSDDVLLETDMAFWEPQAAGGATVRGEFPAQPSLAEQIDYITATVE